MPEPTAGKIDEHYAPARPDTVYTVELDGEAVLLDERENRLHHLNHTATLLWNCFDGAVTVRDLAREVSEELALPYETVLAETLAIVTGLVAEGLLEGTVHRASARDAGAGDNDDHG